MIIWSGFGFLVPIVVIAAMVVTQLLINGAMGANYYTTQEWPKFVGCTFAALDLLLVGLWMNKPTGQVLVHKVTGVETQVRRHHSFFFIPVQYWSAIVLAFGIYMAIT